MRWILHSLALFIASMSAMVCCAQSDYTMLEIWEMSDDVDSLYAQIMEAHPDPFFFSTPRKLQKAYEGICDQLDHPMTRFEFAGIANQLTKVLEDSHTGLDYLQLAPLAFDLDKFILPINVVSDSNFNLLIRTAWDSLLTSGWQLHSINGQDATEAHQIAFQSYSYTEADALVSKQRVADALWPVIAANSMDIDSLNTVELIHPASHEKKSIQTRGYRAAEYYKVRKQRTKQGAYDRFKLQINGEKDYAYLRVGTFAPDLKERYQRTIKQAFREIHNAGVHHLILDISGNGGGSSNNVEYVYSFIDTAGYNTPCNVIGLNSRLAEERAGLASKRFTKWFLRTFWSKDEDVSGFLKIADLPMGERDTVFFTEPVRQKKYIFNGDVILLIDGMTASAGVDFTHSFKERQRGYVIGEACMGPATGTFGNPALYVLPHSELKFYIATIRYNYDNSFMADRRSIQPDCEVAVSSYDLEHHQNTLIEAALQQILDPQ
jgi:hypothetical protein